MAGEKILIVEDEGDIAAMVSTLLRDKGYRPLVAHDGRTGLALALQEKPDLILLDLRLPQMNGVQVLARLHEQKVKIPVVVVTAVGSEELALHALRVGVKDYVKKPFDLAELLEVIERALSEGRLRRERDRLTGQLVGFNQQLKQRFQQLTALYQVAQALASTLDLDELLKVVLREACRVLGVRLTSIFLLDEHSGELVFRLGTGGGAERLVGLCLAPGQGVAGWVAQHGKPLLVHKAQTDPRFSPAFDQISGFSTETILCVPLIVKGRVIGVVEALNKPQAGFTQDDMAMLRLLATTAAVAIENARLYQNLRDSRDQVAERGAELEKLLSKLVRLQRIALALGQLTIGADLGEVYQRLTEHAATLLDVERSAILLFDAERQELVCQEPAFGLPPAVVQAFRVPLQPGHPVWEAWENHQPLIVNDLGGSGLMEALEPNGAAIYQDAHATMFAPFHMGGRSIGAFQVFDKRDGNGFTPDDQRILEIFASQSAIAIENARLFTREKRRVAEMETLVEIAQAITAGVTEQPQALLEQIARGACQVLRADCAVVYPFMIVEPGTFDVANAAAFGTRQPVEIKPAIAPDDPVHAVRQHNPLICEDIAHNPPCALPGSFLDQEDIQAFVGILLEADEEELGVLYVSFRQPHRFEEHELTFLRLVAHQAALAIAKSQLFDTLNQDLLQTNADLLRKLHERAELQKISNMISATLEIDRVFDSILRGAVSITGAPFANILMMDEESGEIVSHMHREGETTTERIKPQDVTPVPPIADKKHSTIVKDMAKPSTSELPWTSIYRRLLPNARSLLFTPITEGGDQKRIGLLGIASSEPAKFGPDDRRLLDALANQAAIAIQNARYLQALRVYQEQQVEAERIAAIADVAGNMVHRINNTVGAIRPLIQQIELKLERGQLSEDYLREKLQHIRENAQETLAVAQQIQRPFQTALFEPVDVNESIAAAWAGLKTPVGVQVAIEPNPGLPLVKATRQLDEVFRNLMKNALDAMAQQGGQLSVNGRVLNDAYVGVSVRDTGPGIPPELRAKIFHMGTTTKPGGMGYGLWWSRMFLRRLGGDMFLESREEGGCVFTVVLPVWGEPVAETHTAPGNS
jgi:GAF domain-containing protein/ActR/RegA family two-component response regulator